MAIKKRKKKKNYESLWIEEERKEKKSNNSNFSPYFGFKVFFLTLDFCSIALVSGSKWKTTYGSE